LQISVWQKIACLKQKHTRSSATVEVARDADVGAHSLSIIESKYNLRSLNSPTSIKFRYALLI